MITGYSLGKEIDPRRQIPPQVTEPLCEKEVACLLVPELRHQLGAGEIHRGLVAHGAPLFTNASVAAVGPSASATMYRASSAVANLVPVVISIGRSAVPVQPVNMYGRCGGKMGHQYSGRRRVSDEGEHLGDLSSVHGRIRLVVEMRVVHAHPDAIDVHHGLEKSRVGRVDRSGRLGGEAGQRMIREALDRVQAQERETELPRGRPSSASAMV